MGKGNPNPPTEHLKATQWKPGQSGNPGGLSSEAHRLIKENAEKASRIRHRILSKLDTEDLDPEMTSELLRMLKDSEDRGYGAPKQDGTMEHTGSITFETVYQK